MSAISLWNTCSYKAFATSTLPPETKTPSGLTAMQFTIELCPIRF